MKKFNSITATSQGYVTYDENGKARMMRYEDTYQAKAEKRSKNITKTKERIEKLHLNLIQRQMYRRLMYGLKEYTPEQVASFSPQTIEKIVDDYKRTKRYLHILKAKKLYTGETKIINSIFPHAKIGTKDYDWFLDLPKSATLRSLGISTKEVISELIRRKLLPRNFFELTPQTVKL
jgi:hypothetical protein